MTYEEFKAAAAQDELPAGVDKTLEALWYDARGNWDTAHQIVQNLNSAEAAWVHAYLHREEGDIGNANYWYRRANRPASNASLQEEWEQISRALLQE